MANNIASAWRSFWHTMTSNDRHASHDSAFRTGKHLPLSQSRHTPYGSQATVAMESQTDLAGGAGDAANGTFSPAARAPPIYSPGARTQMLRRGSSDVNVNGKTQEMPEPGEIQMQSFEEGLPPPPPVSHSWKRIDRWSEDNFPELYDQLCEGATQNDINELEHELDCSLPIEVRESIACHDGQERGGRPAGILFGCMLLDCEEIVQEWRNWRVVHEEFLAAPTSISINMAGSKGIGPGPSSSSAAAATSSTAPNGTNATGPNPLWRQELLERQDSQPPRAVQKAYSNPGWIPLARDWGGNCIAVDLAPGPAGKWGQVIIFGRDYDCKYVISRSWSAFLAQVADDYGSGKAEVDEDGEWDSKLRLKLFKNVEPPYLEIMRWRTDQKYGRRFPKKKGPGPGSAGPSRRGSGYGSPYGSPVSERGRSPQRFPSTGVGSPRSNPARLSSPLAKVEEGRIMKPKPVNPSALPNMDKLDTSSKPEKLVEAPTPGVDGNGSMANKMAQAMGSSVIDKPVVESPTVEDKKDGEKVGLGVDGLNEEMKTVAI